MTRVLVIDNYDSFVYTLNGYLQQLGAETVVMRNDDHADADMAGVISEYDAVLVSPGPGKPSEAGVSIPTVRAALGSGTPLLGVCLGHQAIAEAFGATVTNAEELMHGKTSAVVHDDDGLFAGLAAPFTATRYHSLAVVTDTVPDELEVTAWTGGDGTPRIVMALSHRELPLHGVQFHPESVLTEGGHRLFANWLEMVGDDGAVARSEGMRPLAPL